MSKIKKERKEPIVVDDNVINFIKENMNNMTTVEMAKILNCDRTTVNRHRKKMTDEYNRNPWTEEEDKILIRYWNKYNFKKIGKVLKTMGYKRTAKSIEGRGAMLNLQSDVTDNGKYFSSNDIKELLGFSQDNLKYLYKSGKLKSSLYRNKRRVKVDDLLVFLKENTNLWDAKEANIEVLKSYFCTYTLVTHEKANTGYFDRINYEEWLLNKIEEDSQKTFYKRKDWTLKELKKLVDLKEEGYTFKEIAQKLNRSKASVESKYYVLKDAA